MSDLYHIISIGACLVGLAMILWGLRLFQIYIILMGLCLGGVAGAILGGMIFNARDAMVIGGIVLGLLGGALAWPMQKLFVFIGSGIMTGLSGLALSASMGIPDHMWFLAGLVLFIVGGVIALLLYEYFIIVVMAFTGSQSLFNLFYNPDVSFVSKKIPQIWQHFFQAWTGHVAAFMFITILFSLFSIYFQKVQAPKEYDFLPEKNKNARVRQSCYLFAVLALCGYLLSVFLFKERFYGGTAVLGINLLSWPVPAVLTAWFLNALEQKSGKRTTFIMYIYLMIFSLTIVPLTTWLAWCLVNLKILPFSYYTAFLKAPLMVVAGKWLFSLVLLPVLILLFAARPKFIIKDV